MTNEPLFDKVEVSTNTAVPVKSALTRGVARANKRMARSGFHRRSFSAPMLAGDDGCVADDEGSSDTETEAESDVEPVTPCDTYVRRPCVTRVGVLAPACAAWS